MVSDLLNRVCYSKYLCARLFSSNVLTYFHRTAPWWRTLPFVVWDASSLHIFEKNMNELYLTMVNLFDVNNQCTWGLVCACVNGRMQQNILCLKLPVYFETAVRGRGEDERPCGEDERLCGEGERRCGEGERRCGEDERPCGEDERLCGEGERRCGEDERPCGEDERPCGEDERLCGEGVHLNHTRRR